MNDKEYEKMCGRWHICKCAGLDENGIKVTPLSRYKKLQAENDLLERINKRLQETLNLIHAEVEKMMYWELEEKVNK